MSADAGEQLQQFVQSLPEPSLKKLAATIELDRGENRYGLPHDAIMQILRPRLAEVRAPRVFTAQRMLCVPFEDMLVVKDPGYKETGHILRRSIMPMWTLLTETLIADDWPPLADAFTAAQKAGDEARAAAAASDIWSTAADALIAWLVEQEADPDQLRKAAKRLGGTRALEDAKEMAYTLRIADILESAKASLPRKPILNLNQEQVNVLKRHYDQVAEQHSGLELYFLTAIMGRLLQPFPILKLVRAVTPKLDDTLASRPDLATAGNMVIRALEADAERVSAVAEEEGATEEEMMSRVRRFAAAFKGITSDIGVRRDGEWGRRMFQCRAQVSDAVERMILRDADQVVLLVLPKSGTRPVADFSDLPDEARFDRSERRARALGETMAIAEEIGLQSACASTINSLRKDLDNYAARIIAKLPKAESEDEMERARAHLAAAVRLIELISNSDEADLLRRRGNAALDRKAMS
ncbi:MAG: hypothetical protein RIB45_17015 [Marivibrio sp.]|uniref:hypothetical protein n=1 Tax=Marivibrio sp. TaxID=2039719 RepID=UPI0032EE54DE